MGQNSISFIGLLGAQPPVPKPDWSEHEVQRSKAQSGTDGLQEKARSFSNNELQKLSFHYATNIRFKKKVGKTPTLKLIYNDFLTCLSPNGLTLLVSFFKPDLDGRLDSQQTAAFFFTFTCAFSLTLPFLQAKNKTQHKIKVGLINLSFIYFSISDQSKRGFSEGVLACFIKA
jgi:hypothetical protein